MKLNITIICILVCLACLAEVQSRRKSKSLSKKVKVQSQLKYAFTADQKVVVSAVGKKTFNFETKIQDVSDKASKLVLGMGFPGFYQTSVSDESGFTEFVLKAIKCDGQFTEIPVIDYRYVKDCLFQDSQKTDKGMLSSFTSYFDKTTFYVDFTVLPNERFDAPAKAAYSNSWKIQMQLKEFKQDQQKTLITDLTAACKKRHVQMNTLKTNAIKSGNEYNSLYVELQNLQVTLADLAKAKDKETQLTAKITDLVKQEQDNQKKQQADMKDNTDRLAALQKSLKAQSDNKLASDKDVSNLAAAVLSATQTIKDVSAQLEKTRSQLSDSQTQLNSALAQENSKKSEASTAAQKTAAAAQVSIDAANLKAKLQADFDAKTAENKRLADQAAANVATYKAAQEKIAKDLNENQKSLGLLKVTIKNLQEQSDSSNTQLTQANENLRQLKANLAKKQTIAQAAKDAQAQLKKQSDDVDKAAKQQQADQQATLDKLIAAKKANNDLLASNSASKAELEKKSKVSDTDIKTKLTQFHTIMNQIIAAAYDTEPRYQGAMEQVNNNKHEQEIVAIVSSPVASIRRAQFRYQKQVRFYNRMAKLRQSASKRLRLQRKTLRHKLRQIKY